MNNVTLIGRLTRDPDVRYTPGSQLAVARFSLAIDRPAGEGQERRADFPAVVVFGRQAETCEQYLHKGDLCGVSGRIQTGKYQNRNGETVYTTEVVAGRVEFLQTKRSGRSSGEQDSFEEDFQVVDGDVPWR